MELPLTPLVTADGAERTKLLARVLPPQETTGRPGGGVKIMAVPREGWRRFFEYAALERETGVSRAAGTYSAVEVRYRLSESSTGELRLRESTRCHEVPPRSGTARGGCRAQ